MAFADDAHNKADELKGAAKQKAGEVTGDRQLQAEGFVEKTAAKVKQAASDAAETVRDAADALRDKISNDDGDTSKK